jgi:hypothetical protein
MGAAAVEESHLNRHPASSVAVSDFAFFAHAESSPAPQAIGNARNDLFRAKSAHGVAHINPQSAVTESG